MSLPFDPNDQISPEVMRATKKIIEQYRPTLEALAAYDRGASPEEIKRILGIPDQVGWDGIDDGGEEE